MARCRLRCRLRFGRLFHRLSRYPAWPPPLLSPPRRLLQKFGYAVPEPPYFEVRGEEEEEEGGGAQQEGTQGGLDDGGAGKARGKQVGAGGWGRVVPGLRGGGGFVDTGVAVQPMPGSTAYVQSMPGGTLIPQAASHMGHTLGHTCSPRCALP